MNYYEKYLLFKSKYLLLKQQQIGGNNGLIDIVSFNVLNPEFNYVVYLFKNYSDKIKQLYQNKISNKELKLVIRNLVKIERKEFELYRKIKIINIINSWIKAGQIVCLQEVNNKLLASLKEIYGKQIVSSSISDDDYRITIVPNNYQIVKIDTILFDNGIKAKECLVTKIKSHHTDLEFVIFNLHIHWQSKQINYVDFAKLIKNYSSMTPFIICGDFNSLINSPNMTSFINIFKKIDTNSITYLNNFTSHNTHNENQLAWIDHILSFDLANHTPTQTTNIAANYNIFYETVQMVEHFVKSFNSTIKTKKFKLSKKELKFFESNNYVSDHKPVFASFSLTSN